MNKEQWTDDILQSTKGMKPVDPGPYMASRIEAKLQRPVISKLSAQWVFASAAVIVFLFIINITMLKRATTATSSESQGVEQLMKEYGWSNDILYSQNFPNHADE